MWALRERLRRRWLRAEPPAWPYGLMMPVVRAMTANGAAEVQLILEVEGILSTTGPPEPARPGTRWPGAVEVLVFPEDAGAARRLLRAVTREARR